MIRTRILPAAVALLLASAGYAQDWKKNFPGDEAIYTNVAREVQIRLQDGQLVAANRYEEDLLLDTDKAAKMMSRGQIYHSSFSELKDWEAYTRFGEGKKQKVSNTTTNSSREDYIFFDDSKTTSFDYSGMAAGATRHLDYELHHKDVHLLSPHYFDR
ncbi:MAG TPA: DUF3857 domain-containing protein, partial [Chitinophagaceae bacterium]|nr:DUF3857 domain-containing protein [Chitinophagaceae bacterium]